MTDPTVTSLQADLQSALTRLGQLERVIQTALPNGLNDMVTGHGYQRFKGGTGRLDKYGLRFLAPNSNTVGIYAEQSFSKDPSTTFPRSEVRFSNDGTNLGVSQDATWASGGYPTSTTQIVTNSGQAEWSAAAAYTNTGDPGVALLLVSNSTYPNFAELNGVLNFVDLANDPSTFPADTESVWARAGKLYARINGATVELGASAGMPTPAYVDTLGPYGVGVQLGAMAATAPASATEIGANGALFVPIVIPTACTAVKLWHMNGSSVTGNIDMGIYNEDGTKVVTNGAVAQSGTTTIQAFDIADTALAAGRYYLGVGVSSASATHFGATISSASLMRALGVVQDSAGYSSGLVATATFAGPGASFTHVPWMGISLRTLVA